MRDDGRAAAGADGAAGVDDAFGADSDDAFDVEGAATGAGAGGSTAAAASAVAGAGASGAAAAGESSPHGLSSGVVGFADVVVGVSAARAASARFFAANLAALASFRRATAPRPGWP